MKFTAEDFNGLGDGDSAYQVLSHQNEIAKRANARLAEMLKDAPVVYGMPIRRMPENQIIIVWHPEKDAEESTHTARLVDIRSVGQGEKE